MPRAPKKTIGELFWYYDKLPLTGWQNRKLFDECLSEFVEGKTIKMGG